MKHFIFSLALFLSFIAHSAHAQQFSISGKVLDTTGEPLPGATIVITETGQGTTATTDGTYKLTLPSGNNKTYTITASYIGYLEQRHKVTADRHRKLNFSLSENGVDLETIVVTGTRTPKLLKDAPIITRVITAEDIKKVDVTNVGQLLQTELPGIEFSYSMDQQTSINMQGFGGNSVLFLVDGERLAGETLNNVDYDRLNLDNVERIEIVKGAASTLYGSSAVGGVVNIITRASDDPWNLNLNTRFAEHNEQRYGTSLSFNAGKFNSLTNVQYNTRDSYDTGKDGAYSTVFGHEVWNFKERIMYTPNEKLRLTARAGYYFRERNNSIDSKQRYRDFNSGLKANYDFNRMSNLEVYYTFDQYDKSDYLTLYKNDVRDYSNVQHTVHGLYNYTFNEKHILTVGADYMRDYLMSYQFTDNGKHTQHTTDIYGQFDWNPTENFNVITGLRFDYFSDTQMSHLSPHIGLMYKIGKCSLRGSYSQGFRSPTLKEMYMNFNMAGAMMIYGNKDLKSETSHNFSLSAEYTKSRYNFTLTSYYNIVRNRIGTAYSGHDDNGLPKQQYINSAKMNIAGTDASVSAKYPCGFGFRMSYTYLHEFLEDGAIKTSTTRPHSATTRLEYGKAWNNYKFNLSLNGRALSKVTTNELTGEAENPEKGVTPVTYPGYMMWDMTLTQGIWRGINLNISVNNLLNYVPDYYYANSPYTKGTNFSIGLSLDIDDIFRK